MRRTSEAEPYALAPIAPGDRGRVDRVVEMGVADQHPRHRARRRDVAVDHGAIGHRRTPSDQRPKRHPRDVGVDEQRDALEGEPVSRDPEPLHVEARREPERRDLEPAREPVAAARLRASVGRSQHDAEHRGPSPLSAIPRDAAMGAERHALQPAQSRLMGGCFRPMRADVTPRTDPAQVDVSVVVATYNAKRRDELDACLTCARASRRLRPLEVIVVVDHNPELLAAAREAFPSATVIENRHARGLAGARNTGIDVARGSIVAFVDDDARPEADWLERLHDCFADPDARWEPAAR